MTTYNHALTVAFEVAGSTSPTGEDITPAMLRAAMLKRIDNLDKDGAWEEACLPVYDTYVEDEA